jgi:non-specific serine/threonine protein kinase/serine/threonine-protein kinase
MTDEPMDQHSDHEPTGSFSGVDPDEAQTASFEYSKTQASGQIGPYHLLQQIGEGGMGEVWLAEQTEPVKRRVAVKVIKRGMDSKSFIARFEAERQALALMDHPTIAKVFDAGETTDGRPFFVMEHIQGEAITDYCDTHRLSTAERLDLFTEVCAGVQHAHQKAIIHRDLKPSNVLVAIQDGKPVPKLIDFGVAKALAQPLTEKTMFTELGQMIGTPAYMSPEQAEMSGLNVDTRTDVYSLGVLLYQLLVGALPFDAVELRKAGYSEMMRVLREQEPPRPSTRLSSLGEASKISAEKRQTEPSKLKSVLKGDLDWIVMKALEKDRNRRYDTANGLAMDVKRHLANEPVLAGPPSTTYRAKKFVLRHRGPVIAAALAAVLLIAFGTGMGLLYLRSEANLRRALAAEQESTQISDFLLELFSVANPDVARGEEITARQILDEGARRIESDLEAQPELQARLMVTMGSAYRDLGLYEPALQLLRGALVRTAGTEADNAPFVAQVNAGLAWLLTFMGEYDEAAIHNQRSVEVLTALGEGHERELADHLANYSFTMLRAGDYRLAEDLARQALEIQEHALEPNDPSKAVSLFHIGWALQSQMDYPGAESAYLRALDLRLEAFGDTHPSIGWNLNNLGFLANQRGQYLKSVEWLHRALAVNRRLFDQIHPEIATNSHNLGVTYRDSGHLEVAEQLLLRAVAMRQELLGPDHAWVAKAMDHLAKTRLAADDPGAAESLLRQALAFTGENTGDEIGFRRAFLAEALLAQDRPGEALIEAESAARDIEATTAPDHWWTSYARSVLGECLAELRRFDEAEQLLVNSFDTITRVKESGDIFTVESIQRIVRLYRLTGDAESEARYQAILDREMVAWRAQRAAVAPFADGVAKRDLAGGAKG